MNSKFRIFLRFPTRASAVFLAVFLPAALVCGGDRGEEVRPAFANDLGPAEVDVSKYPARMRRIYRDNFLKNCSVCHSAARAVNAQFLELDEESLERLRREAPELLSDPSVLFAERDVWKRYVKRMRMRPPCCGACPVMTQEESREIWEFLVYDSRVRKTGANARAWQDHRRTLLRCFAEIDPRRFEELYGGKKP